MAARAVSKSDSCFFNLRIMSSFSFKSFECANTCAVQKSDEDGNTVEWKVVK